LNCDITIQLIASIQDGFMKLTRFIVVLSLSLASVTPLVTLLSRPVAAAEQTLLLCQGNVRTTARIYRSNGTLMMRLYDRQNKSTWFNSAARDATNPEQYVFVNQRGEGTYQVSAFRNGGKECSISLTDKPLERGTVQTSSIAPPTGKR
jgi:hypothetical protein